MKTIRMGVFETNSSSCHSLSIITEEQYRSFEKGDKVVLELYWSPIEHQAWIDDFVSNDGGSLGNGRCCLCDVNKLLDRYRQNVEDYEPDPDNEVDVKFAKFIKENWNKKIFYLAANDFEEFSLSEEDDDEFGEYLDDFPQMLLDNIMCDVSSVNTFDQVFSDYPWEDESGQTIEHDVYDSVQFTTSSGDKIDFFEIEIEC